MSKHQKDHNMHLKTTCNRSQLSVKVVQCVQVTPECVQTPYKANKDFTQG